GAGGGGGVAGRKRRVSGGRAPEAIGGALGLPPAEWVCAVKCHWSVNSEPAAISTTYLTAQAAGQVGALTGDREATMPEFELYGLADTLEQRTERPALGVPAALHVEVQPPPSSIARGLRLGAGQPAAMITVRFDDPA